MSNDLVVLQCLVKRDSLGIPEIRLESVRKINLDSDGDDEAVPCQR